MRQDTADVRTFAEEPTQIQRSFYANICSIIRYPIEAQDLLQETNRNVWERYEEYQPGTNLAA